MKKFLFIFAAMLLGTVLFAQSHAVYFEVWDCDDVHIAEGDVTFEAVILERPTEIVTEADFGWGYGDVIPGYLDGNVANGFSTWGIGETLEITLTQISTGYSVTNSWVLTSASYEYYPNPGGLELALGEDCAGGPAGMDWGDGVTGTVDVGTGVAGGVGYGSGLANEDLLANPENVGYWFTLTVDDGLLPADLEVCLLGLAYDPLNLAYWYLGEWVYEPLDWMSGDCVTFTIQDPVARSTNGGKTKENGSRADVDIPIVFSNEDGALPVTLSDFSTAIMQNEFVEISWTTQSESAINNWNLYRSTENYPDEQILLNTQPGTNTPQPTVYSFEDHEITEDITYFYYLEVIEYDGSSNMWGPISAMIEGEETPELPTTSFLESNYPNPFNPSTIIKCDIKENEEGKLTIYNSRGQVIESVMLNAGEHIIEWDGTPYGSGVYLYKLETNSYTKIRKMMMIK